MKEKKPIYKRWWFILIVVLFALGTVGNIIDGGKTENKPTTQKVVKKKEKKKESNIVEITRDELKQNGNRTIKFYDVTVKSLDDLDDTFKELEKKAKADYADAIYYNFYDGKNGVNYKQALTNDGRKTTGNTDFKPHEID